jgi:CubicO group peptidase (beta-lactamase class C family)
VAADLGDRVQATLDRLVAAGEVGLQAAVIHRGEVVADAVAGRADSGRPMTSATLVHAASAAKGVAGILAHVLVDRGELDDDLRLADVWPGFGCHGTEAVTFRHVLLHTAGLPFPPPDLTVEELVAGERLPRALADAEPVWPPGTRFGYHAVTFGALFGEAVRRATGRTAADALRELVTGPLGVVDEVHFGVPPDRLSDVARQHEGAPPPPPEPGSLAERALPAGIRPDAAYANRPDVLTADLYGAGTMTARGVATVYDALARGALVGPERLATLARRTYEGPDEVMGVPASWAFGFSDFRPALGPRPGTTVGMVGMNGSVAFADLESGFAVAVLRNRWDADLTAAAAVDRLVG